MVETVALGNTLKTNLTVKDDAEVLTDPTTLTLTVRRPSAAPTTYSYPADTVIVKLSTGIYYAEAVLDEIGLWEWDWATTTPSRDKGGEIYVAARFSSSAPYSPSVVDYTRLYLGGENWSVLFSSDSFGVDHMLLAIEIVKRRVLTNPPSPSGESVLNQHVLAYLGILTALELIPATQSAWASKLITRSTGNDPAEVTTYTDRSRRVEDLQSMLLDRVAGLRAAALPYLDETLNPLLSTASIDEDEDCLKVTDDPRQFPPAWSFPFDRDTVIRVR